MLKTMTKQNMPLVYPRVFTQAASDYFIQWNLPLTDRPTSSLIDTQTD